jgi:hypothetical protein
MWTDNPAKVSSAFDRGSSRLTSCCVQSSTASFAFEVFSFLMGDKNFQIIEITLT